VVCIKKSILILVFFLILFSTHAVRGTELELVKIDPTFYRKVSNFTLTLSTKEMEYFLDNLDYASEILNEYDIHSLKIKSTGNDTFYAEDDEGLSGTFKLMQKKDTFREFGGQGVIVSKAIGQISADVIASVHYKKITDTMIMNEIEFWVRVNNSFLNFLCRLFKPVLNSVLKNKLKYFIDVIKKFGDTVRLNNEDIMSRHGLDNPDL
jgi:hypothetical protein